MLTERVDDRFDVVTDHADVGPVFGTGLDSFGQATVIYQTSGDLHYAEAHNEYLQVLAEGGLMLGAVVLLLIVLIVRRVHHLFQAHRDLADIYWIRVGASVGLLGIAIQSLVEFSLQMPGNAALFTTLVAIALYSPRRRHKASRP